jgi:hypothetical protein
MLELLERSPEQRREARVDSPEPAVVRLQHGQGEWRKREESLDFGREATLVLTALQCLELELVLAQPRTEEPENDRGRIDDPQKRLIRLGLDERAEAEWDSGQPQIQNRRYEREHGTEGRPEQSVTRGGRRFPVSCSRHTRATKVRAGGAHHSVRPSYPSCQTLSAGLRCGATGAPHPAEASCAPCSTDRRVS